MPQRVLNACQSLIGEHWPYAISWLIITLEWCYQMPAWAEKVLVATVTGFALAFGKWLWERLQQKLRL
jgi:hypothetical protein